MFLYQCLTYADCHVRLPVLISFLSLERESSTSVSSAYVFTLYVLSHLIRRFNRQKVYAFQKKLSTRRAIRTGKLKRATVPVLQRARGPRSVAFSKAESRGKSRAESLPRSKPTKTICAKAKQNSLGKPSRKLTQTPTHRKAYQDTCAKAK